MPTLVPRAGSLIRHPASGGIKRKTLHGVRLGKSIVLLSEWPEKLYLDERACLQRLGDAHEVDRRDRAARKIQTAWGDAVSKPEMRMCRRRLLREFAEMTE